MRKSKIYLEGFLFINIIWLLVNSLCKNGKIPDLWEVYRTYGFIMEDRLLSDTAFSLLKIAAGVSLALLSGGIMGYFMARRPKVNKVLEPVTVFLLPVPKAIFMPVAAAVFGYKPAGVIIIMLIIIFNMIINVRDAALSIDRDSVDYILSLGGSRRQLLGNIVIPEIIPAIFTTLRTKIVTVISTLLVCEALGAANGMGYYIFSAWYRRDMLSVYRGIMAVCFIAIIIYQITELAEYKLVRKKSASGGL